MRMRVSAFVLPSLLPLSFLLLFFSLFLCSSFTLDLDMVYFSKLDISQTLLANSKFNWSALAISIASLASSFSPSCIVSPWTFSATGVWKSAVF